MICMGRSINFLLPLSVFFASKASTLFIQHQKNIFYYSIDRWNDMGYNNNEIDNQSHL